MFRYHFNLGTFNFLNVKINNQARSGLKFKEQNFLFDFLMEVAKGFGRPAY